MVTCSILLGIVIYIALGILAVDTLQSNVQFWTLPTVVKVFRKNPATNPMWTLALIWPLIVKDFYKLRK